MLQPACFMSKSGCRNDRDECRTHVADMMNYYNYFTEIEEHFVRRRGKHLLVSPMDWGLIAAWRDAGIPLNVAIRGIDIAMDGFLAQQHRGNSKVNSLCYCHDAVMAEFAQHLEMRIGESTDAETASVVSETGSPESNEPGIAEITGHISERIREIKTLSEKQYPERTLEGLQRVRTRLEEVLQVGEAERFDMASIERDLALIDSLLTSELRSLVPSEEMVEWEMEAKKELKVYKKRLPKETYAKIHDNFVRGKLHRKFNIGELSLFQL
jgi:hypothetical protein